MSLPNRLRRPVVLSDRTILAEIEAERIVIEPFDENLVQPASVDVRVDRSFRVSTTRATPTSTCASRWRT